MSFTYDESLSKFTVTTRDYAARFPSDEWTDIATGTVVFSGTDDFSQRTLLLQRAAGDSLPNLWETSGGACDDGDASILHGAVRELWEETGLIATKFKGLLGEPYLFHSSSGKKVIKFNFLVEIAVDNLQVRLDPNEHQNFVWASEEEVLTGRTKDAYIRFTNEAAKQTVLSAFRVISRRS